MTMEQILNKYNINKNLKIVILGGTHPPNFKFPNTYKIIHFSSTKDGGNGECKKLCSSIKSMGMDLLIVNVKFCDHGSINAAKNLCKKRKIPVAYLT